MTHVKSPWVGFWVVVLICFSVYVTTVARTVTGYGDSDELLTTGYLWSVPHPPGYPLLNALVFVAMHAPLPVSLATRGHLVSAVLQALTVGLVYLCGVELTKSKKFVSAIGALMLGFSFLFWLYANTLEVVALNNFLIMSVVWLSLKKHWALGIVTGLMLAHHQISWLLLPGLLVWWSGIFKNKKQWLWFVCLGLVSFVASYALLFSFNKTAFVSWRFSPTAPGFWQHFSRSDFGGNLEGGQVQAAFWSGVDMPSVWNSLRHYITVSLPAQWGWWLVPVAIGMVGMWKKLSRRIALGFMLMMTGCLVVVGYLAIPEGADYYLTRALTERMYVMGYVLMGLMGVVGLAYAKIPRVLVWILPVIMLLSNYRGVDLSDYGAIDGLAHAQLAAAPDGSLIVCGSDTSCFSLLYLQGVEKERLGVTVLPVPPQLRDSYLQITEKNPFRIVDTVGGYLKADKKVFFAEVGYPYAKEPRFMVEIGTEKATVIPLKLHMPIIDERNSYQMALKANNY